MDLSGKRIAILVADEFEEVELTGPCMALRDAGAETFIVSPAEGEVQAVRHHEKSARYHEDVPLDQANSDDFDALLLPGGALNPDKLRTMGQALVFVRGFDEQDKPIAVICHGPWTLVSAGIVNGRTLTSWPSLQDDIRNAGGHWLDHEVVVDRNWVSSRKPQDLPAFNKAMLELFANWEEVRKKELALAA